ncbi:MAG: NACHT domain-containing protein [Stigonema ocellatum SAG 48.90 = DSM 106950]|nr:NACHT domain-containing protein [Stigonema ocellatum SAG 48.90 = DSM 106950]
MSLHPLFLTEQGFESACHPPRLETEVKRRGIDTKYVPLGCIKEEIDPVTKRRIAVSHYQQEDGWIDGYIDVWLDDPAKEHISVLGEFGTGKTWFAFHYAWNALQRYRDAQKRCVERPRLPLVITLRDYAKALNVENVLAGFFFTQHNIRLNSDVFDQLNRMGKLLLIFDGFDEMAAKVDRQQMINNFWELAKVVVPGAKVILTCRTEHFPEAKEGRALLNAELLASTANLTGETPQFEVLELEKFNDEQICQALSFQAQSTTVEQVMGNPQLLDLARRPVMTELILEALPDIEIGKPVDMSRVYLYAVRRKMERDIKAERTFTSLADKLYFLCELSWEMVSTDQMSLNYRLFPERIRRLFGSVVQEEKDLDHWHFDMMGQTMLIRNADGDYTPAHRSLLEFFVAYKFAAELGVLAEDFTELAHFQSCLDKSAAPVDYTWSGYFARQLDQNRGCIAIAPLRAFTSEPLEKLKETFGRSPLTQAVMDLLLPMLADSQRLINIIEAIRGKTEDEVGYVGGNAATLVVKLDKAALEGKNLSCTVIKAADFTNASLRRTNFVEANLSDSIFTKILGSVWSIAFSPNGKLWATGDGDGIVRVWEVDSGRELFTCKGHTSWIYSVAFSPDNKTLASSSGDKSVRLWNILTGECWKTLQGHTTFVRTVAFSPNGKILASGSGDTTVRLWDIPTGKCIKILQGHHSRVRAIALSSDSQTLASGSADTTIRLWDIPTGECIKVLQGHTGDVRSIIFSSNGQILASGGDKTVKLWNVSTGQCLKTLEEDMSQVNSIAFHPDGQILASGDNKTVKLWNVTTGQCLKTLEEDIHWVNTIAFHPDGQILASGGDKTVKLWNVTTGQCLKKLQGHTHWVNSIAFHPNGQILASGGDDAKVRLWDIRADQYLTILQGHIAGWVRSVVFSSCGETLASASDDQTVRLWDTRTGQCLKVLQGHTDTVRTIAFYGDGKLATGSYDQTVRLWNTHTGECLQILKGDYGSVSSIAFSRDYKIFASVGSDNTVKLWDTYTGECLKILHGHHNTVRAVTFNPNSRILASAGDDQIIRLWDIHTGECLKTLRGHHNWVRAIVFSPDGKTLASGSHDKTVRLWDIETGECIKILPRHTGWIRTVAFSPDGTTLASGGGDGTIQLWDAKTGECLKTLVEEKPYEDMNITGVKGLTETVKATLKALGAVEG